MIKLKIVGKDEREKACGFEGEDRAELVYTSEYIDGDRIVLERSIYLCTGKKCSIFYTTC